MKKNIKAPRHWPLCREFTWDRWIPRTNGQKRGKCFHLMTSSCPWNYSAEYTDNNRTSAANKLFAGDHQSGLATRRADNQWLCKSLTQVCLTLPVLNVLFDISRDIHSDNHTSIRYIQAYDPSKPGHDKFPRPFSQIPASTMHLFEQILSYFISARWRM